MLTQRWQAAATSDDRTALAPEVVETLLAAMAVATRELAIAPQWAHVLGMREEHGMQLFAQYPDIDENVPPQWLTAPTTALLVDATSPYS